jgi:hypothetical protein
MKRLVLYMTGIMTALQLISGCAHDRRKEQEAPSEKEEDGRVSLSDIGISEQIENIEDVEAVEDVETAEAAEGSAETAEAGEDSEEKAETEDDRTAVTGTAETTGSKGEEEVSPDEI